MHFRDFASITRPLVHLTKKGVPFNWGEPQQNAMQCLKDAICQSPALHGGLCTIKSSMGDISWLCQLSVIMDTSGRHTIASGTRVSFQSRHICCCTFGGLCWLTTSSGTSTPAMNAKFTKLPDCTSPQLFLSWVDSFTKSISILWLCLNLAATATSSKLGAL